MKSSRLIRVREIAANCQVLKPRAFGSLSPSVKALRPLESGKITQLLRIVDTFGEAGIQSKMEEAFRQWSPCRWCWYHSFLGGRGAERVGRTVNNAEQSRRTRQNRNTRTTTPWP